MSLKVPEGLETERTLIRPFKGDDLDGFYTFMSDGEATKYLLFTADQKTFEGTKELLDKTIANYDNEEQIYALAVERKADGNFIGSIGFGPDWKGSGYQMFWMILPEYWKKGYGIEVTKKLLEYAFSILGLELMTAYSHPDNIASEKLALKLGMVDNGIVDIEFFDEPHVQFVIRKDDLNQLL
ncbi:MAG: GNAT family N-acetyltransferase [Methanococcoides sp.]|jgi:RimJ/RimL family protein N-acetyltransferase|uniref:GNAT family N-acetyltransferase n=1 Tax=Methanococcoides seepicolus TaxID=2828780 RepID=A0A9E4ZG32_9EURY|nr:GNAT family N-acetyltransferase [Methanococcoides seepicolus]MCM1987255.1 GNAT family N-acetyltransferase [Methanococcoides seepicolus]NOQ48459.1 GNAT family N-acetyltransferase [Methanococcoides sp.]